MGAACILSALTVLCVRPAVFHAVPSCPSVQANVQVQFKHQPQDSLYYSSCRVPISVTGSKGPLNPILTGLDLWKIVIHSVR